MTEIPVYCRVEGTVGKLVLITGARQSGRGAVDTDYYAHVFVKISSYHYLSIYKSTLSAQAQDMRPLKVFTI